MNSFSRSTALKIAAALSFLGSIYSFVFSLPLIAQGAQAANTNPESIPYGVALTGLVIGVIGVVAAYGAWKQQRWGVILTILVQLVNGLAAAPGILFAPTNALFVAAIAGVVLAVVVIILCLWRDRRAAIA